MEGTARKAVLCAVLLFASCDGEIGSATVYIENGFGATPPWTICAANYLDVEFGKVGIGETSGARTVEPGMDHVLMVAAWDDPDCHPENCLPIATRNEEEVVDGQTRTLTISKENHQGPCPPEGVQPIPQALYERILAMYPDYGFKPYDQRQENPECLD